MRQADTQQGARHVNKIARLELIRQIFIENTGLPITAIEAKADDTYIITTEDGIFQVDANWGHGKNASILFASNQPFLWKGNRQVSAKVEVDPELMGDE